MEGENKAIPLEDSWVTVQGVEKRESEERTEDDDDMERLIAEASGGESDTQLTPSVSSKELQFLQKPSVEESQMSSHQSSRATSPPREFEVMKDSSASRSHDRVTEGHHRPFLSSLCVIVPLMVCSHLAFFALGYFIGVRSSSRPTSVSVSPF